MQIGVIEIFRRIILLLLCSMLFIVVCKEEPPPKDGLYHIRYYTNTIYNHSVGNDFKVELYCEGIQYKYNGVLPYNYGQKLTVETILTEIDKIPDIGTGTIEITLEDRAEARTQILLTETSGQYKGNTALIEIIVYIIQT